MSPYSENTLVTLTLQSVRIQIYPNLPQLLFKKYVPNENSLRVFLLCTSENVAFHVNLDENWTHRTVGGC
jgi:hypothetical protein